MSTEIVILCLTGIGWLIGQWILKNRELEYKHFEKKAAAYQNFLNTFIDLAVQQKTGKKVSDQKFLSAIIEFKKKVMIWGSQSMIKDLLKFQEMSSHITENPANVVKTSDFLYKMIRKDLGHYNFKLRNYELAQMFLIDNVHDLLKKGKNHD